MPNVLIPQKQATVQKGDRSFGSFLPMVGGLIGSAVPGAGPAGGMVGSALGSAIAGEIDTPDEVIQPANSPGAIQPETAAARRMAKIEQDPYTAIAQANLALDRAPKDIQEAYRKPLQEAMEIARKSRDQAAATQRGGLA